MRQSPRHFGVDAAPGPVRMLGGEHAPDHSPCRGEHAAGDPKALATGLGAEYLRHGHINNLDLSSV